MVDKKQNVEVRDQKSISKNEMQGFLRHLSTKRALVCPVDTGKVIEFREVDIALLDMNQGSILDATRILDDHVSYKSIKEYYFPQTELMFTFENDDIVDNKDIPGYAIFGARPCDLEALRVMTAVYSTGKYADPFFHRRFEANFLIGIGCKNLKPECFCQEMGVDKEFSDFCDVMLTDNGDCYIVEYLSEKGRSELDGYLRDENHPLGFVSAQNHPPAVAGTLFSKRANKIDEPSPGLRDAENAECRMQNAEIRGGVTGELEKSFALDVEKDDTEYFDIIDWAKVTEMCKGCGICTYICPTCYCFDFKDVSKKGTAERYKCWDSCMYPKFTLHASGHNPREHRHERYRQRVLHKYKYVPNNFDGVIACTGCGRCVRSCPVGVNIKDILKQIIEKNDD